MINTIWDAVASSVAVIAIREFFKDIWQNIFPSVVEMA
jgi:hypothetical protein